VLGVLLLGGICLVSLLAVVVWRLRKAPVLPPSRSRDRKRQIIVDGSNVLHWGGDPSLKVLVRVLQKLVAQRLEPLVYFDANVGYVLFDRHVDPAELAEALNVQARQVTIAPSRVTADEVLLRHALRDGLRVVSNDRFLDWKQKFPQIDRRGFLVKGRWQQGTVILRDRS
jgi:hypothetical protein